MKTYAVRGAALKITGHYRRPGTTDLYCGRPAGDRNALFASVRGWKLCHACVKAADADRAAATATATAALDPETAGTLPAIVCISHGDACHDDPKRRHIYRPASTPADADRAAAAEESRYAAALITEAEAADGTWRGQWIGARDDTALFTLPDPGEQGALFT
ncbi:hypothetical protein [Streptomyces sp. DT171]|uniref:hypothetical protein n=1 Tax=Streptomyces sp. DT171 TaxID=3416524 RepID=UPI003CEFD522